MKYLSVFALSLLFSTNALCETSAKSEWRLGLSFEQQVYMRQGLRVERVDGESGSSLGITVGSQNATYSDAEGTRLGRKVVDFGAFYAGGISITPTLKSRLGLQVGYMTFHNGTSTSSTGAGYFDVSQGLAVSYGKVDFFTDLAFRSWLFGTNKELVVGERRLESAYVYPRLGFNVAI